jgi:hypothetical protein
MIIRKSTLFLFLFTIVFGPFLIYKLLWIARSEKTNGIMGFAGKSYTGTLAHTYAVISFRVGKDTIWFNGNDNILYQEGETVPVRYQKHNPYEARIDIFPSMWGDTLVYGGGPVLVLLVLFLHPHVFPRGSKFRLSLKKPFIQLLSEERGVSI